MLDGCLPQLLNPREENENETKIVNIQVNSLETIGGLIRVDRWVPEADTVTQVADWDSSAYRFQEQCPPTINCFPVNKCKEAMQP